MGIAILVIFSIGLYQVGKWAVFKAISPSTVAAKTETVVMETSQPVQAAVSVEQSWVGFEAPTFVRRGMPFPVLKEKAKRKRAKKPKLEAAPAPLEEAFPMGDWTLFANTEGDHHVTTH
jgi:hypothetical protein